MTLCAQVHAKVRELPLHGFPFDVKAMASNGIYLLFEKGEEAHGGPRVVRVGTHTGEGQLRARLQQHFLKERKDRSIFRKNIGRCLLARSGDPYLTVWEKDLTTKAAREQLPEGFDPDRQAEIERTVSAFLQRNFTFVVVPVAATDDRLRFESALASLLFSCPECTPSAGWLGRQSPKTLIRESGLWQVNGLRGAPLETQDLNALFG